MTCQLQIALLPPYESLTASTSCRIVEQLFFQPGKPYLSHQFKSAKHHGVSDKHNQWSDSGPIKSKGCRLFYIFALSASVCFQPWWGGRRFSSCWFLHFIRNTCHACIFLNVFCGSSASPKSSCLHVKIISALRFTLKRSSSSSILSSTSLSKASLLVANAQRGQQGRRQKPSERWFSSNDNFRLKQESYRI